jgi:hypothetical protein
MHPRIREILDYLDDQRASLLAAYEAVPVPLRNKSPEPGRWSAAGVVEHLSIVELRLAEDISRRIVKAKAEGLASESSTERIIPTLPLVPLLDRTVHLPASEVSQPSGLEAKAAWAALEAAGNSVRGVLRAHDGLALGNVVIPHSRFESMSAYYFLAFVGAHETRHAAQILEIAKSFRGIE